MNVVLGVSGSIAAYRAADLARELMRSGFTVTVCLTDAAQKFVTPALFEGLTGQPCLIDAFEEPERGRMAHIDLARKADLLIVAPATANTLNRIAHGIGDDMLTTLALAYEGRKLFAPAMNPSMYANPLTQESIRRLEETGAVFVQPIEGDVACGENGQGKLASVEQIAAAARALAGIGRQWAGKRFLITSGPTQEPIDNVRFLTNRSSGKMGAALAQAALWMGADVTLISGPSNSSLPRNAKVVRVRTAQEMLQAALAEAGGADVIIGAAAVADYRPSNPFHGKLRRTAEMMALELVPNPDVLAEIVAHSKPGALKVGFAAEPNDGLDYARQKLARKGLDAIALNDISRADIGFDASQNEITLLLKSGSTRTSGMLGKLECALWLLAELSNL